MVPNGWNISAIDSISDSVKVGFVGSCQKDYRDSGIPLIRTTNLKNGKLDLENIIYVTSEFHIKNKKSQLKEYDLLIARHGNHGSACMVPKGFQDANCLNIVIVRPDLTKVAPEFMLDLFNYSLSKKLSSKAAGSTQTVVNTKEIASQVATVPPLPEQRKIAKILSTWDKAISTTERLIDNSKQQKKALMQQLLTGKKRLLDESGKPFEGEWEEVKLDDIARYHKGYTYKSSEYSEESTLYGFLTLKSFLRGGGYSSKGIKYLLSPVDEKFSVIEGDLIFAVTDLTRNAEVVGAPVLVPNLEFEKSYISMDIVKLDVDKCVDKTFLFYLLKIRRNRNFMRARASGSTVLHLDVKGSKKLKLRLPKLKSEQCRIATVLINADKEIELLEQQLTDLKQEKKAMMQQLLTGKRRVKVDKKEVA